MTQNSKFYEGEQPLNYEQKCPVLLVLDRSGSMSGSPIIELNKALLDFEQEIKKDAITASRLDISVISFGSDVKVERDFGLIDESNMPQLSISGSTKLVDATRKGIEMIKNRKAWYQSTGQNYYRPYIILITDGEPDSDQDVDGLAKEMHDLVHNKHLNFWPIAVNGADMQMLNKIAVPGVEASMPPLKLDGVKFVELFKWLSSSFAKISKSKDGDRLDTTPEKGQNPFQFTV